MKKVVILATGGTIAGRGEMGRETNYRSGEIGAEELLAGVPGLERLAVPEIHQVANVNSDDISAAHWLELERIIRERAEDPEVAGFVITHGTDTLEETAFFLHLTVKTDKPVVLTGSMRPATATSADGPGNLYAAVAAAVSPEAAGRGVLAVFADRIYSAREVQKVSTFALEAFNGRDYGCLGYVLEDRAVFVQQNRKPAPEEVFAVAGLTELPPVAVLYFTVDADPALVLYAAEISCGLVLAGGGNGNYSLRWKEAVEKLVRRIFPVVRCSRTGNGPITRDDGFDCSGNVIRGGNLPPAKARILLQLALTQSSSPAELKAAFERWVER